MRSLPALDTHAHISPSVPKDELERLGAVVFAATRSLGEFESTTSRSDLTTVWGVGTHPALASALTSFNMPRFERALDLTPLVSEVGLDGSARPSFDRQLQVFSQVCNALKVHPRLVSVHSRGASGAVLDVLETARLQEGVILHWWRGSAAETLRAVDLGCYFSINLAMIPNLARLVQVPPQRLLIETDHPYGDRNESDARPGNVSRIEAGIESVFGIAEGSARALVWSNLASAARAVEVVALMPSPVQRMLQAAASE